MFAALVSSTVVVAADVGDSTVAPRRSGSAVVTARASGEAAVYTDLLEAIPDGRNGRTWNTYSLSPAYGGPLLEGSPTGVGTVGAIVVNNRPQLYARGADEHLLETIPDGRNGRTWNTYDLTAASGGPLIVGAPAVTVFHGQPQVYTVSVDGHLLETIPDGRNGRTWNTYDLTAASGGPRIDGSPAAVVFNDQPRVYSRSPFRPNGGQAPALLETIPDGANGRTWNTYTISSNITDNPAVVVVNGRPTVYTRGYNGHRWETIPDGANGSWNTYDLTTATGAPPILGSPAAVVYNARPQVYTHSTDGHLLESIPDGLNGRNWNTYNLTTASGAPPIEGNPAVVVYNGPQVYAVHRADVTGEAVMCSVRADVGDCWEVDSRSGIHYLGQAGWGWCPDSYIEVGRVFDSNGFWMCAHNQLANTLFAVGNVVADYGTLYLVHRDVETFAVPFDGVWGNCAGIREIGRYYTSNGWWLCHENT